ncbi:biotin-dependent carboxyltransferase family protein [Clostridium sp. 19966]|uniref:5-oxoprolinase subunit C family protein n=1 Tax=Clostridium sp. 19966 TaxID=2768166 RepID=UPI0028DD680B|nr:biotin-dependent carboxyltransferase family protein [Clostridium sp. 19966]MDT8717389.1 biotin-dependent carboxyltransferase family protein [Clostridium sp. 19966]
MNIRVLTSGLLTTIQDKGRYGYQKQGVIVSGAMDMYSMRLANIAVGNDENEGVLEITLIGPSLSLEKGSLISIIGADISPTINEKKVPMGRPIYLREDCVLKFGKCLSGCRCYLAVAGGFNIQRCMESKSTYLRAKLGGKDGRALIKKDVLELGEKSKLSLNIIKKLKEIKSKENFVFDKWYMKDSVVPNIFNAAVRVFEDRQFEKISEKSIDDFFRCSFAIDSKSDRMGYRLKGPKINFRENIEMISEEVSFGTIQIPPEGNPIILLADRATAGGYPKIAHVASYDLHKLVQLKPSDTVNFKKITMKEAESLYLKREKYITELKKSIDLINI